jgi:hypothetical protein
MPGAVSGTGDTVVNGTDAPLSLHKLQTARQTVNKIFSVSDEWFEGNKTG